MRKQEQKAAGTHRGHKAEQASALICDSYAAAALAQLPFRFGSKHARPPIFKEKSEFHSLPMGCTIILRQKILQIIYPMRIL